VELVSRMMDGSISYDPKARLEPVLSGATVKQGDKIERLKGVRIFEECSQRQLRSSEGGAPRTHGATKAVDVRLGT
jgi:hypothetical protein